MSDRHAVIGMASAPRARRMDDLLASVEKQAFIIALTSCRDQDVALDIVQDAMFRMVKSYSSKPVDQWRPLFFKVLSNRIADQHRKRGLHRLTRWFGDDNESDRWVEPVDQLESNDVGPEDMAASSHLGQLIESSLHKLAPRQQQVILLRLFQGLSVKETAAAMCLSEGSVKTHLSRAVREMRVHLQDFISP